MGRWLRDRGPLLVMVGALLGLGLAVWAFFSVALPRVAEAVLSGALGVPVRVVAARPTWPLRLLATGVTIGPDAAPTVSVARLYLAADFATWFGGVPSGVRVEFWGPRVHAVDGRDELLDGLLRRLSKFPSDGAPVRIDSLRFDESRIEQRDGLPIVVAGFELSDLEVSRSQPNAVSVSAELAVMTSVGRLVAEVGLADGGEPGLLVGVDATDLSLGVLVRDPAWQLGGRASGRVWYERFRQEGVLEALVGVDVSIQDFVYGADDQRLVAFDELSLVGVSVDPLQRRVSIQELVGAGGLVAPSVLQDAASAPLGWSVKLGYGSFANVGWAPRADGARFTLDALDVRDLATWPGTGAISALASYGSGRIEVEAERSTPNLPGTMRVGFTAIPVGPLLAGRTGAAVVRRGELDADLVLHGPPGVSGTGRLEMRGLDAVTFAGGEEVPLFEVVRVGGDVAHGSLSPARLRFHRVWIEEPHLWVRWDESGFELEQILAEIGTAASEESPLAAFHAGLVRWAGDGPVPTSVPPPMGARIVDGEVELRDGRTEPPFEVRLRKLQALLDGPAGTAGPLQLRMEAAGPARSRVRFSETSSTSGVSLTVGLDNVRFRHLDAYVHALTGYEAVAGRIDLEARARLRPVAQAEIEVEFEGIRLRGDGGADPSALLLGAPLPEIVERLEGETGQGVLQIGLQGDPERLSYGFLEALPDALLKAVDAALRGAPGTPSELASGTVSDPVPPGPVGGQTSEDPAPERP